jgi:hypothetical protein
MSPLVSTQHAFPDFKAQPLVPTHVGLPELSNFTLVGTCPPSGSHVTPLDDEVPELLLVPLLLLLPPLLLVPEPPLLLLPELLPELLGFPELEPVPELEEDAPFEELGEPDELAVAPLSSSPAHGGSLARHAGNAHATVTTVRVSVHVIRNANMNPPEGPPRAGQLTADRTAGLLRLCFAAVRRASARPHIAAQLNGAALCSPQSLRFAAGSAELTLHDCRMQVWPIVHSAEVAQTCAPPMVEVGFWAEGQYPPCATVWHEVFALLVLEFASPQHTWPVPQSTAPRQPKLA